MSYAKDPTVRRAASVITAVIQTLEAARFIDPERNVSVEPRISALRTLLQELGIPEFQDERWGEPADEWESDFVFLLDKLPLVDAYRQRHGHDRPPK